MTRPSQEETALQWWCSAQINKGKESRTHVAPALLLSLFTQPLAQLLQRPPELLRLLQRSLSFHPRPRGGVPGGSVLGEAPGGRVTSRGRPWSYRWSVNASGQENGDCGENL
jgi:hypothetical protein